MGVSGLLVPLSETVTVRQTVGYAVDAATDGDDPRIHLVVAVPHSGDDPEGKTEIEAAKSLLGRAEQWVREDAASHTSITVETAILGGDEYFFGPREYAEAFATYAEDHDLDRVVLDPEFHTGTTAPLLQPFERELSRLGVPFEEAPIDRPARHERIGGADSLERLLTLFVISYGFYLILGDPTYWFDLVTGAAVAAIVTLTLSHVTFAVSPGYVKSPLRTLRFGLYVPYLVFEIVKANLAISLVILRPSMPIDPSVTRVHTRVRTGLPLLALANSITLTPGTLTVRANDQRLIVHTLIPSAREDLFGGSLERAIRFVFHGRAAARIATPEERGDAEIIASDEL